MSTTLNLSAAGSRTSRRMPVLAAASALVAAASIGVTLAVTNSGSDTASRPASAGATTAEPDRATLYRHGAEVPNGGAIDGQSAAERFHHFR